MQVVITLARADGQAGNPYASPAERQAYHVSLARDGHPPGRVAIASLHWPTLEPDLTLVRHGDEASALRRLGSQMRQFLLAGGWGSHERDIVRALPGRRPVHITVISNAAELYRLPWECLTLGNDGVHLGTYPQIVIGHAWPDQAGRDADPVGAAHHPTRVLMAWSPAGGPVPSAAHQRALVDACVNRGRDFFVPARDVIAGVTMRSLRTSLAECRSDDRVALHVVCHGVADERGPRLVWSGEYGEQAFMDPSALRDAAAPFARRLVLITLAACHSGDAISPVGQLGSFAQELHKLGVPWVIGARYPLDKRASERFARGFYERLLGADSTVEQALAHARDELYTDATGPAWSSLQLYCRARHRGLANGQARSDRDIKAYATALYARLHSVPLLGMAARHRRPAAQIEQLFVPVPLTRDDGSPGAESPSTAVELLDQLREAKGRVVSVLLGGPGSGKSSICRYLICALARGLANPNSEQPNASSTLLPVFVSIRRYVRELGERSSLAFLDFVVEQARTELQVSSMEGTLFEHWLHQGRVVAVFDGLDEAGDARRRGEVRECLQAFCATYPRAHVVVTSRESGYRDTPLCIDGLQTYIVQPLTDEMQDQFVHQWYTASVPDDPDRRSALIAQLQRQLAQAPAVRELARRPLLATLIAVVHHTVGDLPQRRSRLYDRFVTTLLETWPEIRARKLDALEPDWQRHYLQELAWHMHAVDEDAWRGLDIVQLTGIIAGFMRDGHMRDSLARCRHIARQWLEFMAEESGLLIESEPERFEFLHLSFIDYLAARRFEREHGDDLACALAGAMGEHLDSEMWAFLLDMYCDDLDFLGQLLTALDARARPLPFALLLRAMSDGAAFSGEQVAFVLDAILTDPDMEFVWPPRPADKDRSMVMGPDMTMQSRGHQIARVLDSGNRNAAHIRSWFHGLLGRFVDSGEREPVRRAAMLFNRMQMGLALNELWAERKRAGHEEMSVSVQDAQTRVAENGDLVVEICAERGDVAVSAAALLHAWPETSFGLWAAGQVELDAALEWARGHTPLEYRLAYAMAGIAFPATPALCAGLGIALVERCLWMSQYANERTMALQGQPRPDGVGLPRQLSVMPGTIHIPFGPQLPRVAAFRSVQEPPPYPPRPPQAWVVLADNSTTGKVIDKSFLSGFTRLQSQTLALAVNWVVEQAQRDSEQIQSLLRPSLFAAFTELTPKELTALAHLSLDIIMLDACRHDAREFFFRSRGDDRRWSWSDDVPSVRQPVCAATRSPAPGDKMMILSHLNGPKSDEVLLTTHLSAISAAEAFIALTTCTGTDGDGPRAYLSYRLQNRWLNEIWPVVEACLGVTCSTDGAFFVPADETLALYLALGWCQQVTTGIWPATALWNSLLGEPPTPAWHWLARCHWYLCHLAAEPDNPLYQRDMRREFRSVANDDPLRPVRDVLAEWFY